MAAHIPVLPPIGSDAFVRGDPAAFVLRVQVQGEDVDVSEWTWRSHVRTRAQVRLRRDDSTPVSECETFEIMAPSDLPGIFANQSASEVPCVVVARWTPTQTARWRSKYVADLEVLAPVKLTWVIIDALRVDGDATWTEVQP